MRSALNDRERIGACGDALIRVRSSLLAAALVLLRTSLTGAAQGPAAPELRVAPLPSQGFHLDGVLDEPAWAAAPAIEGLTMSEPRKGDAPSARTRIGVLADAHAISIDFTGERDLGRLPWGHFAATLTSVRLNLNLSSHLQASSFIQYDTTEDSVGTNTRFRWTYAPAGELFVVYNHNVRSVDDRWRLDSNQLLIKPEYSFRYSAARHIRAVRRHDRRSATSTAAASHEWRAVRERADRFRGRRNGHLM